MRAGTQLATLPNGQGGAYCFSAPATATYVRTSADWAPLWEAVSAPGWRIVFMGFEAASALAFGTPLRDISPVAAVWRCPPPDTARTQVLLPAAHWRATTTRAAYMRAFARCREEIRAGEYYQLNLTARFRGRPAAAPAVPTQAPMAAWLHDSELALWSASPELFLRFDLAARTVGTAPIKGTVAAGTAGRRLAADPKEHAEHTMIVDMARNDLSRVCVPGSVRVPAPLALLRLSYATHLVSTVEGRLAPAVTIRDVLAATLPPASVTGTPKRRACAAIRALEATPRHAYTGVLGWIDPEGRGLFSVLIRTVWRVGDAPELWYGSGGGIVADSDPEREYAEMQLKLAALQLQPQPAE